MITFDELSSQLNYDSDTGLFTWKKGRGICKPGSVAGHTSCWGYIRIAVLNRKYPAHQLAWLMVHGELPTMQIDHIDGNKANNAIGNLRLVTASLNQLCNNNPRSTSKTGLVGVFPSRGKFKAQIKIDGKGRYLGEFPTKDLASAAYMAERSKHLAAHGIKGETK